MKTTKKAAPTPAGTTKGAQTVVWREIGELLPYARNARLHSAEQVSRIAGSIAQFGFNAPVIVDAAGEIIAGHGRVLAAKSLGMPTVPVVTVDHLAPNEVAAYRLADNRLAELATWDEDILRTELERISQAADANLELLGWTAAELGELMIPTLETDTREEDAIEVPAEPVTMRGDLWHLGDHRIMCGDSTSAEDLESLMLGTKASLIATDPPYLVNYDGGNHPKSASNDPKTRKTTWVDYREGEGKLFHKFLAACLPHSIERAPVYHWFAQARVMEVLDAWKENGLLTHQTVVWVKARPVLIRSHFMQQSEPCMYGWRVGMQPTKRRRPPSNTTNVWAIDQAGGQEGIHPTQKPLEIFSRPISWHTLPGEIVLEPFSGSGTCIIAADRLRRRCHAMEISAPFVDVAILRWQRETGREAKLHGGGTFEKTRRARVRKAIK